MRGAPILGGLLPGSPGSGGGVGGGAAANVERRLAVGRRHGYLSTVPRYFDLEITLVLPRPVWRRILLPSQATFAHLHRAIQDAFGWEDRHLFEFRKPGPHRSVIAGVPSEDELFTPTAGSRRLRAYFGSPLHAAWCEYEYDFGDSWLHEIKERGLVSHTDTFRRRLIDGDGMAPPEDCGGTMGYERILAILETGQDPMGEPEDEILAWIGTWRPDVFDLARTQRAFDEAAAPRRATRKKPPATAH